MRRSGKGSLATQAAATQNELDVNRIALEFGSFSEQPRVEGTRIGFDTGDITELHVEGMQACEAQPVPEDGAYKATHGPDEDGSALSF